MLSIACSAVYHMVGNIKPANLHQNKLRKGDQHVVHNICSNLSKISTSSRVLQFSYIQVGKICQLFPLQ